MNGPPNMPETDWKASAQLVARKFRRADEIIKLAYRKLSMGDDSIGSNELGDEMANYLCDLMGDKGYQEWLESVSPWPGRD